MSELDDVLGPASDSVARAPGATRNARPKETAIAGASPRELTRTLRAEFQSHQSKIPEALKQRRGWLVWKINRLDVDRGKFGKVPYYPVTKVRRSGSNGDPADLARLGTWEEAIKAFGDDPNVAGLGFAMLPQFGLLALDADKCVTREDGALVIPDVVTKVSDTTYSELSPSGSGIRAFWLGAAQDSKNHQDGFELFHSKGFVTVTGNALTEGEPAVLSKEVAARLTELIAKPARVEPTETPPTVFPALMGAVMEAALLEATAALTTIPSDDRELWINMGHALKTLGESAHPLWHKWSATSVKYDPSDAERVWRSFQPKHTGYEAILQEARRWGWTTALHGSGVTLGSPDPVRVDLRSLPLTPPPVPFIIPGWLPAGVVTLFSAHGGTGKSFIALYIAICLALGRDPFRAGEAIQPRRVVFYSAEDGLIHLQGRIRRYLTFLEVSEADIDPSLMVLDATGSDSVLFRGDKSGCSTTNRYNWLTREVKTFGADLLIFDNASDALDGNENDRAAVRQFMSTLRNAAPTVLLLAHVDAATVAARPKEAKGYSGSTAWNNSARSRWFMTRTGEDISLSQPKVNYARAGSEVILRWDTAHSVFKVAGCYEEAPGGAAHRLCLLGLVASALDEGLRISPHTTANNNAYKTIKDHSGFPERLDSRAVQKEVGHWLAAGWATTEEYSKANRQKGYSLVLTEAGRAQLTDTLVTPRAEVGGNP